VGMTVFRHHCDGEFRSPDVEREHRSLPCGHSILRLPDTGRPPVGRPL
jgi:hypothetical protein